MQTAYAVPDALELPMFARPTCQEAPSLVGAESTEITAPFVEKPPPVAFSPDWQAAVTSLTSSAAIENDDVLDATRLAAALAGPGSAANCSCDTSS